MRKPAAPDAAFAAVLAEHRLHVELLARQVLAGFQDGDLRQDLQACGHAAPWEAWRSYDPGRNNDFWGYARARVHGAMLDELRRWDHLSRDSRQRLKQGNLQGWIPPVLQSLEASLDAGAVVSDGRAPPT